MQSASLLSTTLAVVTFDDAWNVSSWSDACETLLGYRSSEIIGKSFASFLKGDVFPRVQQCLLSGYPYFKIEFVTRYGDGVKVLCQVFPEHTFVLHGYDGIKQSPSFYAVEVPREAKRTFRALRLAVLHVLSSGKRMTINQIAHATNINWKTVEKHLTFLIGKKLVQEVFSSEYVRIFEITHHGYREVELRGRREYGVVSGD